MNSRTHFQNENGSIFSKVECQLACALFLYVRTRRHRRRPIDHSQPPTLEMLNEILREARYLIWDGAFHWGAPCNPMPPEAHLNAYCLVRNLRSSISHYGWFEEVRDQPERWVSRAWAIFDAWIYSYSPLVQELEEHGTLALYM